MHELESSNPMDNEKGKMPDELTRAWIAEAIAGNRECQKRLYESIASRVYRVVRKIVGSSNVDDVMQDFVIQFFAKLDQFRFESSLETWAHRMAVNQSLQFLRKTTREEQRIRKAAHAAELVDDPTMKPRTEDAEVLQLALEKISGEQRALLHMKEVEGLGYGYIASVLGIPEGTVGSRLNKARSDLKNSLLSLGWEP